MCQLVPIHVYRVVFCIIGICKTPPIKGRVPHLWGLPLCVVYSRESVMQNKNLEPTVAMKPRDFKNKDKFYKHGYDYIYINLD